MGTLPGEGNEEIKWHFTAPFTKCVPNNYIMARQCPAPFKVPTSRLCP